MSASTKKHQVFVIFENIAQIEYKLSSEQVNKMPVFFKAAYRAWHTEVSVPCDPLIFN